MSEVPAIRNATDYTKNASMPGTLFPDGLVSEFSTDDFDELAEAALDWDQEYSQIQPGSFTGRLFQVCTSHMQINREYWSKGLQTRGSAPPGAFVFAIIINPEADTYFCGNPKDSQHLIFNPEGREFEFISKGACEMLIVSIDDTLLDEKKCPHWLNFLRQGGAPSLIPSHNGPYHRSGN